MSAAAAARLKLYVDRMSQPSHTILIFCKANDIYFEEVRIDISKRQHRSQQFIEINPMGQVPAILDGRFKQFESHAILKYLACSFPGIPDHWYPADLSQLARLHSAPDGKGKFLLGSSQPSIADLSLVCEKIMQLEVVDDLILGPYSKVRKWIRDVKVATNPHFEQVHEIVYKVKARLQGKHSKL